MAEKNNATCSICGKGYYKCLSCKDLINLNPWKMHTDTSEHYKIYQILHGYSTGIYNKIDAKLKLKTVDLSDFDNLRDNIKDIINDIMGENENTVNEVVGYIAINLLNDNAFNNCDDEESVFDKTKVTRKRKSFKVVEAE